MHTDGGVWILTLTVVLALLLAPFQKYDVSELLPVQTLCVSKEDETLVLRADGGLMGRGSSLSAAVRNLHQSAPGRVVLSTTGQLVVTCDALPILPELLQAGLLRPATQIYAAAEPVNADDVTEFLLAHPTDCTLSGIRAAALRHEPAAMQLLRRENGRYFLRNA